MDFSGKDLLLADAGVAVAYLLTIAAIAVGLLPMTPLRLKVAKGSFWGACAIFALLAITWGVMTDISFVWRAVMVGGLCALAGIGAVETSRFLMHANAVESSAGPASPAPVVSAPAPAPKHHQPATEGKNVMGQVTGNSGIVTQGQSGNNSQ